MGWAARVNPRSRDGGKLPADVYAAQLQRLVTQFQTPRQYDSFLALMPEEVREDVRQLTRPYVTFDLAAIAREDALITRATAVAAQRSGVAA